MVQSDADIPAGRGDMAQEKALQRKMSGKPLAPCLVLSLLVLFIFLLAHGCSLTQVPETPAMPAAVGSSLGKKLIAARPILFFDAVGGRGSRRLVIKSVYSDGRELGILVPGQLGGWSRDGTWFAYFADEGTLNLMNLAGEVKAIFKAGTGEFIFSAGWQWIWSPDGKKIALILGDENDPVYSIAVVGVPETKVLSRHRLPKTVYMRFIEGQPYPANWPPYKLRWSPDGRKVLLSWETTVVIDTLTGSVETVVDKPTPAEWAPEGDGVYYFDGVFRLEDFYLKKLGSVRPSKLVDKGQLLAYGLTQPRLLHGVLLTLSPRGGKLAVMGGSTTGGMSSIHIYNIPKGGTVALDRPSRSFQVEDVITALEWAPDEDALAATAVGETGVTIKLLHLSTGIYKALARLSAQPEGTEIDVVGLINALSWTP